jgi:uncharacterized damage-inducible protein DinB
MHPRTQELLQHLDDSRLVLREAVDNVPASLREKRPAVDRWSVAEVLEHLSVVEAAVTRRVATLLSAARDQGLGQESDTSSVLATFNLTRVLDRSRAVTTSEAGRPKQGLSATAAWAALDDTRAAFRQAVVEADGLALGTIVAPHPALGPMNLYHWIAFVGGHELRHAAQIREIESQLCH